MNNELKGKYFVRKETNASWEDVTTKFVGIKILSLTGMNEQGEAVNVYTEQFVDSPVEDVIIAGDNIIRKNVDLQLTFICSPRYGASDTRTVHDTFISYMTSSNLYVKSAYTGMQASVINLKAYKPTTARLHRGNNSYILGTIELHCIQPPTVV